MSDLNSMAYYQRREQQERSLAAGAHDPAIAAIHHDMAKRYSELIWEARPMPVRRLELLVRS